MGDVAQLVCDDRLHRAIVQLQRPLGDADAAPEGCAVHLLAGEAVNLHLTAEGREFLSGLCHDAAIAGLQTALAAADTPRTGHGPQFLPGCPLAEASGPDDEGRHCGQPAAKGGQQQVQRYDGRAEAVSSPLIHGAPPFISVIKASSRVLTRQLPSSRLISSGRKSGS